MRVTVGRNAGERKFMNIPPGMTFEEFKKTSGQKLGIQARKVFTDKGVEVEELDVLRDEDALIITDGSAPVISAEKKKKDGTPTIKVAVIGSGGVGKSAITIQYVQCRFVTEYDPTIEDAYRKQTQIDNKACFLEILDTAGQEDYVALRSQWLQEKDGYVLVYAINDRNTFDELESFRTQILRIHDNLPPLVILGNKCDLKDRAVERYEGEKLALSWGPNVAFFESSAKENKNIDKAFEALVRDYRKRHTGSAKRGVCAIL